MAGSCCCGTAIRTGSATLTTGGEIATSWSACAICGSVPLGSGAEVGSAGSTGVAGADAVAGELVLRGADVLVLEEFPVRTAGPCGAVRAPTCEVRVCEPRADGWRTAGAFFT